LGLQKKHGLLITTERARAYARGQNAHSPLFLEVGTKHQELLVNLKSGAEFR